MTDLSSSNHLRRLIGLSVLPIYFAVSIGVGFFARRKASTARAFLSATNSIPLPVLVASYIAANCGALEIVGLSALAAQYGIAALHFYYLGAIPAIVFLALWMMPVYRESGVHSVPQYLNQRYGAQLQSLNASVLALTMLLLAGISLYAMGQVLQTILPWGFAANIVISAVVVLIYVQLGGFRATIYNEVLQLGLLLCGLVPLFWLIVRRCPSLLRGSTETRFHLWNGLPAFSATAPIDGVGLFLGLGFVLSFGYWCTDFVLMQRAFAARTEMDARKVPLWAGFGKLIFSGLVVVPGLAAAELVPGLGHTLRFDQALPSVMSRLYGPEMLGVGLASIAVGLMSGLAANVSGFAAIWTEDIYRRFLRKNASDRHYLLVGRLALLTAVVFSVCASYVTFLFGNLMEHVQLIFSIFAAPFWAIFLLGMLSRRTNARAAIAGFSAGVFVALLHLALVVRGALHYGSGLNAAFRGAVYSFTAAVVVATVTRPELDPVSDHAAATLMLKNPWKKKLTGPEVRPLWVMSILLMMCCALLNWFWR